MAINVNKVVSGLMTAGLLAGIGWVGAAQSMPPSDTMVAAGPHAGRYVDQRHHRARNQPDEQAEFAAMAEERQYRPYQGAIRVHGGRGTDHMNHWRPAEEAEFAAMGAGRAPEESYPDSVPAYSGRRTDVIHRIHRMMR